MVQSRIGSIEAICLIVIVVVNHIILNLPKAILSLCGSASLLNIIYVSILVFILTAFIVKLFRPFLGKDIIDIASYLGGKKLKILLGICYLVFFIFVCSILLRSFSLTLKILYFDKLPLAAILLLFLIVAYFVNRLGRKTVIRSNLIIVPIVVICILIVCFSSADRFTPERIFPILGYGTYETFGIGISNLFAFSGIAYLFFLSPLLEKKENFKKVSYWSIAIITLLLIFSIASLLFTFPFMTTTEELSSIYMEVRNTHYRKFSRKSRCFIYLFLDFGNDLLP